MVNRGKTKIICERSCHREAARSRGRHRARPRPLIRNLLAKARKQRALAGQDPFILLSAFGAGLLEAEVEDEPPQLELRTVAALA